jgi:hypothetical protein
MVAAQSMDRFTGYVGNLARMQLEAQQPVTAFDKFDFDQSIDEYASMMGVPPTLVRSDDDVAAMRKGRAQAAQAQQMAQAAQPLKDGAQAVKALGDTKLGTGSVLDAVA